MFNNTRHVVTCTPIYNTEKLNRSVFSRRKICAFSHGFRERNMEKLMIALELKGLDV
ncbi:hypothetical protein APHWI1_0515 [Anaplasma phagocytophilum str. ApWI1]|uniref:Uncharacterized protein n=2 Tax=Anaplasma phagocytophilum TaxID=948 RepID=A0A0F3N593_ANAPH|nr:hypothetical protein EPHNCH_1331 [Anaplasma phagocytophilum str. NCH-1]KJV84142.1 hypothetical protein APHWI1_0515 [Anaplasma phagocytophilum str. ApWI1]